MKRFVIIVVTFLLVGLDAYSITNFPKKFEDDDNADIEQLLDFIDDIMSRVDINELFQDNGEGDTSSTMDVLGEAQTIEVIEDTHKVLKNYKDVMGCSGNTCIMCYKSACVSVTYMDSSKQFRVSLRYMGITIFSRNFAARNVRYCRTMRLKFMRVTGCVEISNLRISSGRACVDLKLSISRFSKTFHNLCM